MKTNKHTAGPWRPTCKFGGGTEIKDFTTIVDSDNRLFIGLASNEANARLIASAPEMLEALERMVKLLESIERETGYCTLVTQKDAYKLIKEARGES